MYNAKIITNYYHISLKYENDRSRLPSTSNTVADCTLHRRYVYFRLLMITAIIQSTWIDVLESYIALPAIDEDIINTELFVLNKT